MSRGSESSGMESTVAWKRFDVEALRRRWSHAFAPKPLLYWSDMLSCALVGWLAFALAVRMQGRPGPWLVAVLVAVLSLYRAVLFIHELAHLKRRAVAGFETVWNLLVGIPLLVPSLMYVGSHGEHHRQTIFGTDKDPEYQPIGQWTPFEIVSSLGPLLLVPFLLVLRWGLLGPLSYLVRPLRRLVVGYASTLVINPSYCRREPRGRAVARWAAEETAAGAFVWLLGGAVLLGWIPAGWLLSWYVVAASILVLNHVRTLAAHRYRNDGGPVDLAGQYLDSVNLSGDSWLTPLLAPVGLRYHALHHLLPSVPYHSLGYLHRRLLAGLPTTARLREAEDRSLSATMAALFEHAARRKRDAALVGKSRG